MAPNLYLERLRANLGARYSQHTVHAYLGQAERFLDFAGTKPRYTKQELLSYVDTMVKDKYKGKSITTILAGVRSLFYSNDIPWPLDRRDLHLGLPEDDDGGPVLPPGDVAKLIAGVRSASDLPFTAIAVTALSTIYGLRPTEISQTLAAGIDGKHLEVQTAKGGRRREHVIPIEISAVLHFKPYKIGTDSLHKWFDNLMVAYVRKPLPREGWHSVRRSVVTGLYKAKVPGEVIHSWIGWRAIGKNIGLRYFKPEPAEIDQEVYQSHPFLKHWL